MQSHKNRVFKNIISSILVVLIFFFSFITLINISFNLLYSKTQVRGFSMRPTININVDDSKAKEPGDTIYINRKCSMTNNDIVIADVEWPGVNDCIIKRLVGVPGDKIEIKDETTHYAVYVNDKILYTKEKYGNNVSFPKSGSYLYYENYLNFLNSTEFSKWVKEENGTKYIQLGANDYFLMGDNWGQTTDSLEKGPVKKKNLVGKVELIIDVDNKNPLTPTIFFLKKLFSKN